MRALSHQILISLKLHFRNTMALIYGFLFPALFLLAFWALYRYDQVPLVRHLGELLTITVLGGACFGLPTTMVSERERGVWRRYRLTPIPTGHLVISTVAARYLLLIAGGVLQVGLAMAFGMPLPKHPLELFVAFTAVSFAFLGIGLVIAMLADNVPAVQALGQCLFLPMLIIGGVAVPLSSLPPWAVHVSAFLPGRYAVDAMQACTTGDGLRAVGFSLGALLVIGLSGCMAGAKLFRWDREQRFASLPGKPWIAVAVTAWTAIGLAAESRGRVAVEVVAPVANVAAARPSPRTPSATMTVAERSMDTSVATTPPPTRPTPGTSAAPPSSTSPSASPSAPTAGATASEPEPSPAPLVLAASWQAVTRADVDRDLTFDRLPIDRGVVTPIASADMQPEPDLADEIANVAATLENWPPGNVADPVQRARNWLFVLGVHDVAQTPLEAYLPAIVFAQLQRRVAADDLFKVLYWIAVTPEQGEMLSPDTFLALGMRSVPANDEEIRNRAAIYAVKLLGRLTGHIAP